MKPVYIKKVAAYAPGLETADDWKSWAKGEKEISKEPAAPKVPFMPMLTRRRLSTLSKMVVLVNHAVSNDFLENGEVRPLPPAKITFASEFGEIVQQVGISQTILDSGTVSPSKFSLSVYNASVASASIQEKNEAGYSAVFAGKESFRTNLMDCIAALQCGIDSERIFIYADEQLPEVYTPAAGAPYLNIPCAVAIRLTLDPAGTLGELDLDFFKKQDSTYAYASDEALAYIKASLIQCF